MTPNRRIFLNIVATYVSPERRESRRERYAGCRSLYALVIGLFCGRWTLRTLGEVDRGLMAG